MSGDLTTIMTQGVAIERRRGTDRRTPTLMAFLTGASFRRRRRGRRKTDHYAVIDWHSPRVLAVSLAIIGLCVLDAALTLILLSHGAVEVNPFMALFVPHQVHWFAIIKFSLTSLGVFVLVACSQMRLFNRLRGEALLLIVALAYLTLVVYELELLETAPHRSAGVW